MKAIWNGQVIAESDQTISSDGYQYFPVESVNKNFLRESAYHTVCFWKGTASYYDVLVDGKTNKDAAFYYPNPNDAAQPLKGYISFWRGVEIIE